MTFYQCWCLFFLIICLSFIIHKSWDKWSRNNLRKKRKGLFEAFVQCSERLKKLKEIGAPKSVVEKEIMLLNNIRSLLRKAK